MLSSSSEVCGLLSVCELLSSLKTPLSQIPIFGPILFGGYTMNNIQQEFICSACGPFTKNNERIQKSKDTGDL